CREAHRVAEVARRRSRGVLPPGSRPALARFWAKVDDAPDGHLGCWRWTGATDSSGYGLLRVEGKLVKAHRFSFEQFVGPIPSDRQLDHLCRVPACVNPGHVDVVTSRENSIRRSLWNVYERRNA